MEIKFRAKIKENGKQVMFYQNDQYLISFLRRATSFLAWGKDDKTADTYNGGRHESYLGDHELEKCLDQFIGLKDKHGKEIYNGDLLRNDDGEDTCLFRILWYDDQAKFEIEVWAGEDNWEAGIYDNLADSATNGKLEEYEIAGNLWETPELLKNR